MSETITGVYLLVNVNDVEPVDMPQELYEALYQCNENTCTMNPILDRSNVEISHKYYDLIKLLPRVWLKNYEKSMKPAYAL
jgi:hypothetical protein